MSWKRVALMGAALAALWVAADAYTGETQPAEAQTVTGPGASRTWHVPMCFSSSCVEVSVPASGGDGGDINAVVTAGRWYEVTVTADGSGGVAGCWAAGAKVLTAGGGAALSCVGLPKLRDGQVKPMAWAPIHLDGGVATAITGLWFYATITNGYSITLCPEVPCQ